MNRDELLALAEIEDAIATHLNARIEVGVLREGSPDWHRMNRVLDAFDRAAALRALAGQCQ